MKRLLDTDISGMKTWHEYDAATETTIITHTDDVEPLLDMCKADANHADRKLDNMTHVASVPPSIQMEWYVKHNVKMWDRNDAGAVNRLLDGPYKHLKRLPIQLGNYR